MTADLKGWLQRLSKENMARPMITGAVAGPMRRLGNPGFHDEAVMDVSFKATNSV